MAKKLALSSCTKEATADGIEVGLSGGNAVDALVAGAFSLIVSNPLMCSIAGGGFVTVRTPDGHVETIDFFDCMPGKGLPEDYISTKASYELAYVDFGFDVNIVKGHATIGVPGTVKGIELLLNRHGSMPMKEVLKPAIKRAKEGVYANDTIAGWLACSSEKVQWHTPYSKHVLSTDEGEIIPAGYLFKQPDLAQTLESIAEYGSDVIYKGDIAQLIAKEMSENGGLITLEDLAAYEAVIREPLHYKYGHKDLFTNPPPSVGGASLVAMLKLLSNYDLASISTPRRIAIMGNVMRLALHDRFTKYNDPATNAETAKTLLGDDYINECLTKLQSSANTTHISAVDADGLAVSLTMSMGYGSGVAIPGTGIFCDNTLGEIELNPKGFLKANPGTRLISGMTPSVIIDKELDSVMALGTPGATRIPSCLLQVIINMNDFDMSLEDALKAPRIHAEGTKFNVEPYLEPDPSLLKPDVELVKFDKPSMYFGGAQCARIERGENPEAAADPRRTGRGQVIDN